MTAGGPRSPRASWASMEGLPFPLGATWVPEEEEAWNFAVYSEHAEQVTLLLYADADASAPVVAQQLHHLRNKSGPVWHFRVPAAEMHSARFYAYQVDGARLPPHRFDPDKVLFDPYARALHFPSGFDRKAAIGPGANAGRAPLGLIAADREQFDGGDDHRPRHEGQRDHLPEFENGRTRAAESGERSGVCETAPDGV